MTIAIHCLKVWEMPRVSNIQIGVSNPTKWPRKMTRMPTETGSSPTSIPGGAATGLTRSPRVLLAVEAKQAPTRNGQAKIGVPAEHDVVECLAHDDVLRSAA